MPEIIDIRICDDPRDEIHRVVERLAAGELVGLPTETSYVLAAQASHPAAVARLQAAAGPLVLAVRSADEALDFAPGVGPEGERLFRRLWPGPAVIEAPIDRESGLTEALPPAVREAVVRDGYVRMRRSGHEVIVAVQRLAAAPLVFSVEPRDRILSGPAALLDRYGPAAGLVIDDGPPLSPGHCTTVRIGPQGWSVIAPGLLDETAIRDRTNVGVVFVCTGNTCRSPLAEAIFRKLLAERLNCRDDELPQRGFFVASAGLSAGHGMPAAAESLALAGEFGLDLARHRSRPLTDELLDRADYVFAMTAGHREAIVSVRPDLAERVHLLSREGLDIADPIGGGPADYEQCRAEIERELLVVVEHMRIDLKKTRN